MATSGNFYSDFGTNNKYRFLVEWRRESVDIANNKSTVVVDVYFQSLASGYTINSSATKNGTLSINGTSYAFTCKCGLSASQKLGVFSKTVDIYHNSDGTKSFSISASVTIDITFSSGKVGTVSASGTATLDTIPRTSSFSLSTTRATLGSTSITATISRASTSFTHNVYVGYGNTWTQVGANVATSVSWTPNISLASQTPNATEGYGMVQVDTYNGSTYIGSTSINITYVVPTSVKPSISSLTASVVAAGADTSYGYVQGKSQCKVTINGASGSYGSSISRYIITQASSTWEGSSITTGVLYTSGTITFSGYVIDSRGRSSDSKTVSITVNPYSSPIISDFATDRVLSTGAYSDDGTYALVWGLYSYSTLGGKNSITSKLEYKRTDSTSWTNAGTYASNAGVIIGGGGINTAYGYDVRLTISDKFTTISKVASLKPSFVTMDFKAGGKGVSFGKESSDDGFNVSMKSSFTEMMRTDRGRYIYHTAIANRSGAYVKIANITQKGNWVSGAIGFKMWQRGCHKSSDVYIHFAGHETPAQQEIKQFSVEGPMDLYLSGSAGSWSLYVRVSGSWDEITVVDMYYGPYYDDKMTISWVSEMATSVPTPYIEACPTLYGNNWNNNYAMIKKDGVMEVGKYIDFHETANATDDFFGRFYCANKSFYTTNNIAPNLDNNSVLGFSTNRWHTVYTVNGVNASSDRTLKENISYVGKNDISYEDLYDFIKNDLGLAKYNFLNDEEKKTKLNFIAQDILVNADGTDNIIGQLIVNPIPVPTEDEIRKIKKTLEPDQEYVYPTLSFDTVTYISVIAGALKEAINRIEELTNKINELENKPEAGEKDDLCDSENDS